MLHPVDIFGGYNRTHVGQFNPAELMNWYIATDDRKKKALLQTPGLSSENGVSILTSNGTRALFVSKLVTIMHAVVGNAIYQIDSALNYSRGVELNTNTGYVGIADNDYQILFVDGVGGYVYDKNTNLYTQIVDPGFPSFAADAVDLAGRFITYKKDTNEWYYSAVNDATDWDANNRYELTDDIIEAIATLHGRLYILGQKSSQVWYPTTTALSPYARDENELMEFGCVSRGAVANEEGLLIWVATDKQKALSVVLTTGAAPKRISTSAIEAEFQSYDNVDDATAFIYTLSGSIFYQVNFANANKSWLYCVTTNSWSQLTYKAFDRHRADCHAFFNNKHFVGDYENPIIYHFSDKYYDDDDVAVRRRMITDRLYANKGEGFTLNKVSIYALQGFADPTGTDEQPYVELSISRDGGSSYGSTLSAPLAKLGVREWRTDFYRLGTMDSAVLDIEFYNKIKMSLFSVTIDVGAFE